MLMFARWFRAVQTNIAAIDTTCFTNGAEVWSCSLVAHGRLYMCCIWGMGDASSNPSSYETNGNDISPLSLVFGQCGITFIESSMREGTCRQKRNILLLCSMLIVLNNYPCAQINRFEWEATLKRFTSSKGS